MPTSLENILKTEHPAVIARFAKLYNVSLEDSEFVFKETIKMLWLMNKHITDLQAETSHAIPAEFYIQKEMMPLDKMWHEFIIYTKDYQAFCEENFGNFLHHVPCSDEEMLSFQKRRESLGPQFKTVASAELTIFVEYIYDHLGEQTLTNWFKKIPQVFSAMAA